MSEPTFERVRAIASELLQVSERRLAAEASLKDFENWDSILHLNLIIAIEQEFEAQFEPAEMEEMSSIQEIVTLLNKKLGSSD